MPDAPWDAPSDPTPMEMAAEEIRSLTVERDALAARVEEWGDVLQRAAWRLPTMAPGNDVTRVPEHIDALAARVAEAEEKYRKLRGDLDSHPNSLVARAEAAEARVAKLTEALREAADDLELAGPDPIRKD